MFFLAGWIGRNDSSREVLCRNPAGESYNDGNSAGCANCSENVLHCCACVPSFHVQNSLHCLWAIACEHYRTACISEVQSSAFAKLHRQGSHKPAMTSCTKACSELVLVFFGIAGIAFNYVGSVECCGSGKSQEDMTKTFQLSPSTVNSQLSTGNCQPSTKRCHCWYFFAG